MRSHTLRLYFSVTSMFFTFSACKYRDEFSTFAENPESTATEWTPFKNETLYLKGGIDFQGGAHLLHREEVYHNTSAGLNLERITIVNIENSNTGIVYTLFGGDPSKKQKANLSTIYIPKNRTWRGRESEQVQKFLSLCQQQIKPQKCILSKSASQYLSQNSNSARIEILNGAPNLTLNRSSSLDGTWLIDVGLGYEIVTGTTTRAGGFLQVKGGLGTYNLYKGNLVGYFITGTRDLDKPKIPKPYPKTILSHLARTDCLQGSINFVGGSYLVGKTNLLFNSAQNSFKPEPVTVRAAQTVSSSLITIETSSGDIRQVGLRTLYISKADTSIQIPDTVVLDFLEQCQAAETTCFLKDEPYNVLSVEQKQTTSNIWQSFIEFTPEGKGTQPILNGIWLVDMGMGYEIIKGPLKKGATFLTITNTDSRVYNIRPRQLLGYSIPSNETKQQPLLTN